MTRPPRPLLAADAAFGELKRRIVAQTGHFYYEDKDDLLQERVARRLRATGAPNAAAYLALLSDTDTGEAEWAALAAEITIGETFFFRYAEQFKALQNHILPGILEANGASRRIRIWSAGCANGAEPYSVAILLRRLLGEEIATWRVSILGTDVNRVALQAARAGRYSPWALRTLSPEERECDFLPVAGSRSWLLKPQHRALVRFEPHNLMQVADGTLPLQLAEFDLILCRNVLIYFHPDVAGQVVRGLADRLAMGGWLMLGHAEPGAPGVLTPTELPGTLAWRRLPTPPAAPPAPPTLPPLTTEPWAPPALPPRATNQLPPKPARAAPRTEPEAAGDAVAEVRGLADAGDLIRARNACRAGLRHEPINATLHYFDGLIAAALGETAEAERAFRRAVYLRKDFAMAHHQLGLLLAGTGRAEAGRRALRNAIRIACALPDGAVLEEGEGMTAGSFREVAQLSLVPDAKVARR